MCFMFWLPRELCPRFHLLSLIRSYPFLPLPKTGPIQRKLENKSCRHTHSLHSRRCAVVACLSVPHALVFVNHNESFCKPCFLFTYWPRGSCAVLLHLPSWTFFDVFLFVLPGQYACLLRAARFWFDLPVQSPVLYFLLLCVDITRFSLRPLVMFPVLRWALVIAFVLPLITSWERSQWDNSFSLPATLQMSSTKY